MFVSQILRNVSESFVVHIWLLTQPTPPIMPRTSTTQPSGACTKGLFLVSKKTLAKHRYIFRGTENSTQENSTQKPQHIVKTRKLSTRKLDT